MFDVCSVTATQEVNSSRQLAEYQHDFEEDSFTRRVPYGTLLHSRRERNTVTQTRFVFTRARLVFEQIDR